MLRVSLLIATTCALSACAMNSGVTKIGPETFVVSRQAATGFSGLGTLKPQALAEANAHCESLGKVVHVTRTQESRPPYIAGNFPRAEVEFMCLAAGDPRLNQS